MAEAYHYRAGASSLQRHAARLTLGVSGAGAVYALYRAAIEVARAWRSDAPLLHSAAMLAQGGWKLAVAAGGVLGLALVTGWLWRTGRLRARRTPLAVIVAALTATAWACAIRPLWNAWYCLAHDNVTCDGVLIALLLLFSLAALLGMRIGAGQRCLAQIHDWWWLAAAAALALAIAACASQLAAVFSVLATLAVATVLGRCLLGCIQSDWKSPTPENLLLSAGVGAGIVGLLTLAIGHLHLLYWWVIAPAYGAVLCAGWRSHGRVGQGRADVGGTSQAGQSQIGALSPAIVKAATEVPPPSRLACPTLQVGEFDEDRTVPLGSAGWTSLALMLAVILLMCLVGSLGPEVQSDAIAGRLGAPAMYAREHAVGIKPNIFYTYSTCGSEMLGTLAIVLSGEVTAGKVMHFAMGLLSLATVFLLGKRWLDWRVGLLAAFALGSSSIVWMLLTSAYTDLTLLFFGLSASLALFCWLDDRKDRRRNNCRTSQGDSPIFVELVVSGLLAGFAAGVKLTAGFLICPAVLMVWCASAVRVGSLTRRAPYASALVYALCSAVGVVPWLVRTWWYTGNPVWPWLMTWFDPAIPAWMALGYHFSPGSTWTDYVHIPFRMVFSPRRYIESGGHNPLLLALLPGCLGLALARSAQRWFAAYVGVATALWIASDINLRYGLVQVGLLSVVGGGMLLQSWPLATRAIRRAHQGLLGAAAVAGLAFVLFHDPLMKEQDGQIFAYKVALGTDSAQAHAERIVPVRAVVNHLNRTYGADARVWSIVYCDTLAQQADSLAWCWQGRELQAAKLMDSGTPPDELYAGLRSLGVTHLVCSESMLRNPAGNHWLQGVFDASFVENPRYCELEYAANGYCLYRVLPRRAAASR